METVHFSWRFALTHQSVRWRTVAEFRRSDLGTGQPSGAPKISRITPVPGVHCLPVCMHLVHVESWSEREVLGRSAGQFSQICRSLETRTRDQSRDEFRPASANCVPYPNSENTFLFRFSKCTRLVYSCCYNTFPGLLRSVTLNFFLSSPHNLYQFRRKQIVSLLQVKASSDTFSNCL